MVELLIFGETFNAVLELVGKRGRGDQENVLYLEKILQSTTTHCHGVGRRQHTTVSIQRFGQKKWQRRSEKNTKTVLHCMSDSPELMPLDSSSFSDLIEKVASLVL